jgi:hypothetical protein
MSPAYMQNVVIRLPAVGYQKGDIRMFYVCCLIDALLMRDLTMSHMSMHNVLATHPPIRSCPYFLPLPTMYIRPTCRCPSGNRNPTRDESTLLSPSHPISIHTIMSPTLPVITGDCHHVTPHVLASDSDSEALPPFTHARRQRPLPCA